MYILNNFILTLGLLLWSTHLLAQLEAADYRKESYYQFPIKPGERNSLAGTMGELRSTHFHTGIDIRTDGRIGLPVYAAADGYIARAVVSSFGYGNALYIKHPNGHTTVYAHLENFLGPIQQHMLKEHYRLEQFELDLSFHKDQFKISKGDMIAYSGNSGSSGGPHLHFDIRDAQQRPLNPLSYGFDEILDRTPPVAEKIIVKSLSENSRVEGFFGQNEYQLRRIGNDYILDEPIKAKGQIGLMLDAHDKLDYSRFRCGINTIIVEVNGKEKYRQHIKVFSFAEIKDIYKHMSYEDLSKKGERWHNLYIEDGNQLNFYKTDADRGKLNISENGLYNIKITMIDTYENSSFIDFKIIGDNSLSTASFTLENLTTELKDNFLVIKSPAQSNVRLNGSKLEPDYLTASNEVFLHDMRKELPQLIEFNNNYIPFHFKETVYPNRTYAYYSDEIDLYFQRKSLFDTLYLETHYQFDSLQNREEWRVGRHIIPLRQSIKVELKPKLKYERAKYAAYAISGKYLLFRSNHWENNQISFWTKNFESYTIAADTIQPYIKPYKINTHELQFKISDDMSGIKEFNCFVNNKWVLMHYDYKRRLIWSEKLDKNKPFSGSVILKVTDNCNNENIYSTKLN